MSIENLINAHNKSLEEESKKIHNLNEWIKHSIDNSKQRSFLYRVNINLSKAILACSILFILLTFLNIIFIRNFNIKPETQLITQMSTKMKYFSVDYPGSINQAYREVME